ncbi:glycosyl hydrolase family 8 [Aureimonas psammosilenae]|uniref:glycosyl hydrolase family 8 n=1 Tax=Aureimonas psammosilenae TaxID=2495496 RepID=UPI001F29D4FD|nr:glycosyl hydrolase family 8 [Aureimonas psammosilenae]
MIRMGMLLAGAMTILGPLAATPPAKAVTAVAASIAAPSGQDLILGTWALYASRFVSPEGRVIDDVNGGISHSEGQGYGLLIAVAADDRAGFERMLGWTRAELFVRGDDLAAWRWDPNATPHITDRNNATDGDILIAWALYRAAKRWDRPKWRNEARAIVEAVMAKTTAPSAFGTVMLPGAQGFKAEDQPDGPVVNLSYWVFPALEELGEISPKLKRSGIAENGLRLAKVARFGQAGLPADWTSLKGEQPAPAKGFPAEFGYNALRIPLYLAWSTHADEPLLAGFTDALSAQAGGFRTVDLATGVTKDVLTDPGYRAVADVAQCALGRAAKAASAENFEPTSYYPSTLHILALMALAERYPQCLR